MKKYSAKRVASLGILLAAASIVFIIESLVPPLIPIAPYVKLGLANVFVLLVIIYFGAWDAFLFVLAKNLLTALATLSSFSIVFNLAGSLCAYGVMVGLYACVFPRVSIVSVSVIGAVVSNIARTGVAAIIMEMPSLYIQLPIVCSFSVLAGVIVGILVILCVKHLSERLTNFI